MRLTEEQYQALMSKRGARPMPASLLPTARRSKYGNVKVVDADGLTHDSRKEYRRWCELQLRERAGEISNLRRQVVFDLIVNDRLVCRYVADASYVENATGAKVVEDTKSEPTRKKRDYRIKAKLFEAIYGYAIREV